MGARKAIYKQNPVHVAITIALKLESLFSKKFYGFILQDSVTISELVQ
jgi:hypothetical protein